MHNAAAQLFCSSGAESAFSAEAWVGAMRQFEKTLLQAQLDENLMPNCPAAHIFWALDAIKFDVSAIARDGQASASMAVPFVAALKSELGPELGAYMHRGATSQDVLDTAQCLLSKPWLAQIQSDARSLVQGLIELARRHARTPMLARTLMQPASVTSFGFACAGAAASVWRGLERVRQADARAMRLQLAGAVGTKAQLKMLSPDPHAADRVRVRMAKLLGLAAPADWPTHTWRDEWANLGCGLAVLAGSAGKLATDWALQTQFELSEITIETPGQGASSAMPHKRNPVACVVARGAAQRCAASAGAILAQMPQAHQRACGEWQAELAEWPNLLLGAGAAVQAMAQAASHLAVDEARMLANLRAVRQSVDAKTADEWFDPMLANDAAEQALALADQIEKDMA